MGNNITVSKSPNISLEVVALDKLKTCTLLFIHVLDHILYFHKGKGLQQLIDITPLSTIGLMVCVWGVGNEKGEELNNNNLE